MIEKQQFSAIDIKWMHLFFPINSPIDQKSKDKKDEEAK